MSSNFYYYIPRYNKNFFFFFRTIVKRIHTTETANTLKTSHLTENVKQITCMQVPLHNTARFTTCFMVSVTICFNIVAHP